MIGKTDEDAALHRFGNHGLVSDIQTLSRRDSQELIEQRAHLTRRLRVHAHSAAAIDIIPAAFGEAPRAHPYEKIRFGLLTEPFGAVVQLLSFATE
jgi:hypothetical protein